jgi:hypothetical protein
MTLTPSPPATAYFVSGYTTTKDEVVLSEKSETPGALFTVLKAEQTLKVLAEGLARNKVVIAFARRLGGTDIQVSIDRALWKLCPTDRELDLRRPRQSSQSALNNCLRTFTENAMLLAYLTAVPRRS